MRKALAQNEDKAVELIARGSSLDEIIRGIGLRGVPGNIKSGLSRALTDFSRYPRLSEALKKRVEATVRQNQQRQVRNTSINELSTSTGIGFLSMRKFVTLAGIPLTPIEDVDAARIGVLRERYGRGETKKKIMGDLGIDHRTFDRLMEEGEITERERPPTPSRRPEFQTSLLRTILTTEPAKGKSMVGNQALARSHPECGTTPQARRKNLKLTKKALAESMVEILEDIHEGDLSQKRNLWEKLGDLRAELPSEEVSRERSEIRRRLGRIGSESENTLVTRVTREINSRFFNGEDVCPRQFSVRLVRLAFYGDAEDVFHPQIPTPQTLDEVRTQLRDYSRQEYGSRRQRSIPHMSTPDLIEGATSFYYLLLKKIREARPNAKPKDIARTIRWVLTGEEGEDYIQDWRVRTARKNAVEQMLEDAGDNPTAVTTKDLVKKFHGLHSYYCRRGSKSYTESLIMAFDEFGEITPEQEIILRARRHRETQKGLILRYFVPDRNYQHYQPLLGMGYSAVGNAMRDLASELTEAIDGGESPRAIADRYGVGARGIQQLINSYGEGRNRDSRGIVRLVTRQSMSGSPMEHRDDMYSIDDFGSTLDRHLGVMFLAAGGRGKGRVHMPPALETLVGRAGELVNACRQRGHRDFDRLTELAASLGADIDGVRQIPQEERRVTFVGRRGGQTTRIIVDGNLDDLRNLAGAVREEAKFR